MLQITSCCADSLTRVAGDENQLDCSKDVTNIFQSPVSTETVAADFTPHGTVITSLSNGGCMVLTPTLNAVCRSQSNIKSPSKLMRTSRTTLFVSTPRKLRTRQHNDIKLHQGMHAGKRKNTESKGLEKKAKLDETSGFEKKSSDKITGVDLTAESNTGKISKRKTKNNLSSMTGKESVKKAKVDDARSVDSSAKISNVKFENATGKINNTETNKKVKVDGSGKITSSRTKMSLKTIVSTMKSGVSESDKGKGCRGTMQKHEQLVSKQAINSEHNVSEYEVE